MERAITNIIDPSFFKTHKLPYHFYDIGSLDDLLYGCWCYHGSTNLANYYVKSARARCYRMLKKETPLPEKASSGD